MYFDQDTYSFLEYLLENIDNIIEEKYHTNIGIAIRILCKSDVADKGNFA